MAVDVLTESSVRGPESKKIGGPLIGAAMRRANRKDLIRLKELLERG